MAESSVDCPFSLCSSLFAITTAPLAPGRRRGDIPVFVILYLSYSPLNSARSSPLSILVHSSFSAVLRLSQRYLSTSMITGVWYLSAMLWASPAIRKASSASPGAITILGKSSWCACITNLKSAWLLHVGIPVAGPGLCPTTITTGVSVIAASPYPSAMSANPPPAVAVIALAPANPAPIALFTAAISSSACFATTPKSFWCCAM